MNDKRVDRYEDLQLLVQMLQIARLRSDRLQEAERLTSELARLRARCNPELRRALDRLTLADEFRIDPARATAIAEQVPRN